MKVTLEMADNVVAMTVVVLTADYSGMTMHNKAYGTDEIYDGSTVTICEKKEDA